MKTQIWPPNSRYPPVTSPAVENESVTVNGDLPTMNTLPCSVPTKYELESYFEIEDIFSETPRLSDEAVQVDVLYLYNIPCEEPTIKSPLGSS